MSCSDTSLKPQDSSLIYGSIEGDNDKIQPPVLPANAPIDPKLLEKWISSYKTKEQSVLKKISGRISYVPYDQFEASLKNCIQRVKKAAGRTMSLVEPGKSQKWVNEIARHRLNFLVDDFLKLGEEGANMLDYAIQNYHELKEEELPEDLTVYIMDDGSYSGTQMANNISGASKAFEKVGARPKFVVIIPYITNFALNVITERFKSVPNHCTIIYDEIMPTAEEVLSKNLSKVEIRTAKDVLWPDHKENPSNQDRYASRSAFHYFAHKVPNSMSLSETIALGLDPKKNPLHFIPPIQPPYKVEDADA